MNVKKTIITLTVAMLLCVFMEVGANADESEYIIKINRLQNCVNIYKKDAQTGAETAYKSMICSTGLQIDSTPVGTYSISEKKDWGELADGSWGQYCCRIVGSIMIHSVPYTDKRNDSLKTEEYNKLGELASLGCVRLRAVDAQWIYDNCGEGTQVVIYDDEVSAGPFGKPDFLKIPEGYESFGWDPTDTNPDNPWSSMLPLINGVVDIEINEGDDVDLTKNITATDIFGDNIAQNLKVIGEYDINVPGEYPLEYQVTDGFEHSVSAAFKLTVKEKETENESTPAVVSGDAKQPKTGVGSVMKIVFLAVCTFAISMYAVKKK